ncbi:transporter [Dellaglioa sp. BT-FLS60]
MKLKINTIAGISNIFGAILMASSWPIMLSILVDEFKNNDSSLSFLVIITFFIICIFISISLALNIIGLIQSVKNNISIIGHILGIIGYVMFGFSLSLLVLPALVLVILSAIFAFNQRVI